MGGAALLLLLLALGMGGKNGNGNGGGTSNGGNGGGGTKDDGHVGPAGPGSVPSGDPPGGCRLVYASPAATVQALNMLGYSPRPDVWGPDAQLGTYDADPDADVMQFQLDYNQASRSRFIANGGGITPDGLMGKCTMSAIEYAQAQGELVWRDRYMQTVSIGGLGG